MTRLPLLVALSLLFLALVFVLISLLAPQPAVASVASGIVNTASYVDPSGDAVNGGPDLSTLAVSNDDGGLLTFRVTVANRPQGLGAGEALLVLLDVDQDLTSDCNGSERALGFYAGKPYYQICQSGHWVNQAAPPSLSASYDSQSSSVSWTVAAADVAVSTGFNVSAVSDVNATQSPIVSDRTAAAFGLPFNYQLVPGSQRHDVRPPRALAQAAHGRHGHLFRVLFTLADDSGRAGYILSLYRGSSKHPYESKSFPLTSALGDLHWVTLSHPTALKGRYCVRPFDGAGNKGKSSCARLTVS